MAECETAATGMLQEQPRAAALARVDDIEESQLWAGLDDAFALVAVRFFRRDVRVRARACLGGMLPGLERKTSCSLAEHAREATPDGMQWLFTTARWDPGGVRRPAWLRRRSAR